MTNSETHASNQPSARERILLTAHALFYRDGIRATGIDRVIAESGVTKVTFYRHFPSKNDLIQAFLEYRHQRWMDWFQESLARHGGTAQALVPTLAEWFEDEAFRGCAFINSVVELGGSQPAIVAISQRHKQEMTDVIRGLLPSVGDQPTQIAQALALALDGAIVQAQLLQAPVAALASLQRIIVALGVDK